MSGAVSFYKGLVARTLRPIGVMLVVIGVVLGFSPVAQAAVPDRPVITAITTEALSFVVSFKLGANSSPITGIEHSTDNGSTWGDSYTAAACTAAACTVLVTQQTGTSAALAYGDNYDVVVRVTNADGSATSASYPVYFSTTPAAPTITTVVPTSSALEVTFVLGASGGADVLSIDYSTNNGTNWRSVNCSPCATATSTRITTSSTGVLVAAGTTYVVVLRAKNRAGTSAVSAPVTVTSGKAPAAPVLSSVVAGLESLVVASALGAANGATIFDVEYSTDNGVTWRSSGQATGGFTITAKSADGQPLDAGVSYSVRVRAINAAGTSVASAAKSATPIGDPLPPVLDSVNAGTASLTVKGTTGLNMGGTVQRVEYSTDGGTTWASTGQATLAFTITASSADRTRTLAPGTRYRVAVRTVTAAGSSGISNIIEAMVGRVPGAPTLTSAALRAGIMVIAGTLGLDNGSPIMRLEYSTDNGVSWWPANLLANPSTTPAAPAAGSTTSTTVPAPTSSSTLSPGSSFKLAVDVLSRDGVTTLESAATYQVRVRALNAVGLGSASLAVKSTSSGSDDTETSAHKITFTDPGARVLGSAPFTASAKSSAGSAVTIASSTPAVCTINAGSVTLVAAGTCTLVASASATATVPAASASRSFEVRQGLSAVTVGASASLRTVIAANGLIVAPQAKLSAVSKTPKVCRVAKGQVTAVRAGSCRLSVTVRTAGKIRKVDAKIPVTAAK
jgi:hypothetical protein